MTVESIAEPVRKTVAVDLDVERAFALFTEEIGTWWPVGTHSIHGERVSEVVVEGREGGRVYERTAGGEEADWGLVLVWEPPSRLVLEWRVDPSAPAPTEVEVRFAADGEGARVELEHRGWERLGEAAAGSRASYDTGWEHVLGRYAETAGG